MLLQKVGLFSLRPRQEKAKATKNAVMLRMSQKVRSKSKRSLREVQVK
jgi:hypothetical protein